MPISGALYSIVISSNNQYQWKLVSDRLSYALDLTSSKHFRTIIIIVIKTNLETLCVHQRFIETVGPRVSIEECPTHKNEHSNNNKMKTNNDNNKTSRYYERKCDVQFYFIFNCCFFVGCFTLFSMTILWRYLMHTSCVYKCCYALIVQTEHIKTHHQKKNNVDEYIIETACFFQFKSMFRLELNPVHTESMCVCRLFLLFQIGASFIFTEYS